MARARGTRSSRGRAVRYVFGHRVQRRIRPTPHAEEFGDRAFVPPRRTVGAAHGSRAAATSASRASRSRRWSTQRTCGGRATAWTGRRWAWPRAASATSARRSKFLKFRRRTRTSFGEVQPRWCPSSTPRVPSAGGRRGTYGAPAGLLEPDRLRLPERGPQTRRPARVQRSEVARVPTLYFIGGDPGYLEGEDLGHKLDVPAGEHHRELGGIMCPTVGNQNFARSS